MSKLYSPPTNRIRLTLLAFIIIFSSVSCQLFSSNPNIFEYTAFSFTYPSNWQTMEELWGGERQNKNYEGLGLQEIIMITSVRKKGQFGAWFAVATKALSEGESLDSVFETTYSNIKTSIRSESETTGDLNGIPVLIKDYERASGEPWWRYHDVWLEKDGTIYLLSFHCLGSIEKYQEDLDLILNRFTLK